MDLNSRLFRWIGLLLLGSLLNGCSLVAPDDSHFYLLESRAAAQPLGHWPPEQPLVFKPVQLPRYLANTRLLVQSSRYQLTPAAGHVWAEELAENIYRVVALNLAQRLQLTRLYPHPYPYRSRAEGEWQLELVVQRFEGSPATGVELEGYWSLTRGGRELIREANERVQVAWRPAGESYDPLAAAMSEALAVLSDRIAAQLVALPSP